MTRKAGFDPRSDYARKSGFDPRSDDARKSGFDPRLDDARKAEFDPRSDDARKAGFDPRSDDARKSGFDPRLDDARKAGFDPRLDDARKAEFDPRSDDARKSGFDPRLDDARKAEFDPRSDDARKAGFDPRSDDARKAGFDPRSDDARKAEFDPRLDDARKAGFDPRSDDARKAGFDPRLDDARKAEFDPRSDDARKAGFDPRSDDTRDAATVVSCLAAFSPLLPPRPIVVHEGENIRLRCAAMGTPRPTVEWRKMDGSVIPMGSWQTVSISGHTLNITRINRAHMGHYLCMANNGIPPAANQTFLLEVHFPPLIRIHNQLVGAVNGSTATLECEVEAYPESVHIQLNISNFENADIGQYHCIAKNDMGITKGIFTLFGEINYTCVINRSTAIAMKCLERGY
ncbi:unnamed protein product [Timema podura]|uniref:Ig-like domain-containing protein n=1 Tax=Timema podura TaxID=61482 RepID=A0ABN7NH81_TIMPD|nr:unnamed protein product [Timema podura]